MKYSYSNWNNKNGTVPVKWRPHDYESLGWHLHDASPGYSAHGEDHTPYKEMIGTYVPNFETAGLHAMVPKEVDKIFGYVVSFFDLADIFYTFNKYKPGQILPWHRDNYPTYRKNNTGDVNEVVRIIVSLHDPAPGHQLWIEDKLCAGPKGTWVSWQGDTKHMAANLGQIDRFVMQITGKIPS